MPEWTTFLRARGAVFDRDGALVHFGDPHAEIAAAHADVVADLSHLALLRAAGDDACAFLHGQFSSDVRALKEDASGLGAYCTPQGRALAVFRLFRAHGAYFLLLDAALADATLARLKLFVLRARVALTRDDGHRVLGIAGPNAPLLVRDALGARFPAPDEVVSQDPYVLLGLPGPHPRAAIIAPAAQARAVWERLHAARAVGRPVWDWHDIRAGLPALTPATVEAFIPQMLNLDLLGGVHFKKGCYPGQEIVARTQYLGRLKQRMYRFRVHDAPAPAPAPGTGLYARDFGEQRAGTVVLSSPSPEGGSELLAVAQSEVSDHLRLGGLDGPALKTEPLPYTLAA